MVLVSEAFDTILTPPRRGERLFYMGAAGRSIPGTTREELVLDGSFLGGVDARKGRWRDAAAEAQGILTEYYWIGRGSEALEASSITA